MDGRAQARYEVRVQIQRQDYDYRLGLQTEKSEWQAV